ncbi:MAG: L-serine ammonia-lyase, iron-sulfur-dependent, subunit alpha [Synergistota bacterium]|nr:L-serine ammonia-lyase, iron-sulfur-dependent, subunit alpha [Synergistota bacterium]
MRSIEDIISRCTSEDVSFHEAVLLIAEQETGRPAADTRKVLESRLGDMEKSVEEALCLERRPLLVADRSTLLEKESPEEANLSSRFVVKASRIAMAVAASNACMGRIVAAPTAGSCGILPGLLFACEKTFGVSRELLTDSLVAAAGVGEVIAERATLAGASGGCQAECGSAAAMGAAALTHIRGGEPGMLAHAAALTLKSLLGLVCDPVAGLVEIPCITRNGMLVSMAALGADMALAGVTSAIPVDEVIDTMGAVGRALPESLRETARGGLAVSPTGKSLERSMKE